jgi:hypothetical protein
MAREVRLQHAVERQRLYHQVAADYVSGGGIDEWTDADLQNFRAMSQRLGVRPADLLLVLYCESGLKPSAAARNSSGYPVAVGINQITAILNSSLGLTEEGRLALLDATVAEQLPYAEKSLSLFVRKYPIANVDAGALYTLNFSPSRLARGADGRVVLYDSKVDANAYQSNRGADTEKKGWINIENMRQALRRNAATSGFKAALARYQAVTGDMQAPVIWPPPPSTTDEPSSPVWPWVLSLGGAAAIMWGVIAWKKRQKAAGAHP